MATSPAVIQGVRAAGRQFSVARGVSTRGEGDNKARRGSPARRGFF